MKFQIQWINLQVFVVRVATQDSKLHALIVFYVIRMELGPEASMTSVEKQHKATA